MSRYDTKDFPPVVEGSAVTAEPMLLEERILILAPTSNDARLTLGFLNGAHIGGEICRDLADLCDKVQQGCGAILLAEEILGLPEMPQLVETLSRQPTWSDIPIAIITSGGEAGKTRLRRLAAFGPSGNVTLLERPFRPDTLISTAEVALRARRKQREIRDLLQKLQTGEDRLRNILDSISDAFISIDRDWTITYANPSYLKMVSPLYRSAENLIGHNLWEKFPDIKDNELGRFYERAMAEQISGTYELFYPPLELWLEVRAYPSPQMLSLYVQDISERKRNEAMVAGLTQQVRDQARVFDTALSNIADFAYTFDKQGKFIYVNKPLLDLWGLPLDQAVGKNFFELNYEPELAAKLQRQIQQVFDTGERVSDETAYTNPMGEEGYFEYIFSPVFDAEGKVEVVAGSTRVITERKRQEKKLRALAEEIKTQARIFDVTLSHIVDLAYTFDLDGRFLYGNKPLLAILGRSLDEIVGRNCLELDYPPELAKKLNDQILHVGSTGTAVEDETVFTSAAGVADYHEYIFSPVFDLNGKTVAVAGTTRITTRRKQIENALRESEEKLRQIVAIMPAAVYACDVDGKITFYNHPAAELWGYEPEINSNQTRFDAFKKLTLRNGEPLSAEASPMAVSAREGKSFRDVELLAERTDGRRFIINISTDPIRDQAGESVGAISVVLDITERRQVESSIRQLAAIVESSDDAIVSKNLDGLITSWNIGAERLFGYAAEEVIGKPGLILIPMHRHDEEPSILRRIRSGEPIKHYETVRQRKDGALIDVSLSVSPIKDNLGRVTGVSKIARDITEQKKNEAALKEARDSAESANRSKDRFLAVLSHELRTPLTPVLMTVAARERDPHLPPNLKDEMTMIRRNIELETKLIDDLLDLSRITSGKLQLRVSNVDVNAAVHQVCEICRSQILEKNIRLRSEFDETVGRVSADSPRLQQILWNVLKNAAKFTPENGSISVLTRNVSDRVQIVVRDSGVGIPGEALPKIFDAFEQGDEKVTRLFGGLGLGLAISKALVELHGGTISVESEGENQGSTFTIELPAVAGEEKPESLKPLSHQRFSSSQRLLIVEDHVDTAIMLSRLLQASGYYVKTAGNVAGALKILGEEPFDILISDVGLPDGTGYMIMKKVRETSSIRGIAMSGYGMDEDIRKSVEAGFSEHLVKPVNIDALEQALHRLS